MVWEIYPQKVFVGLSESGLYICLSLVYVSIILCHFVEAKKNKIAQQWAPDFLDAIRGLEPISARLKTRLRLPSTVTCCLKRPQGSSKDMVKSMVKSMGILWVIF